jgi:hypothetical protein
MPAAVGKPATARRDPTTTGLSKLVVTLETVGSSTTVGEPTTSGTPVTSGTLQQEHH